MTQKMMPLAEQCLRLATTLAEHYGVATATLGTRIAQHGAFFARIEAGGSLTVDKLQRVMSHMERNWPDGLVWPDGVLRDWPDGPVLTPRTRSPANNRGKPRQ